jgi:hypothetical protein
MIHQHDKGLATNAAAQEWCNVQPAKAANVLPLAAVSGQKAS